MNKTPETSPLGKKSPYLQQYCKDLLFPIERAPKRQEIGINKLTFNGFDAWTAFEVSWLNSKGKPVVAVVAFIIPANSLCLVESKSFKLYLNSFNNSCFDSWEVVQQLLIDDLSAATQSDVTVKRLSEQELGITKLSGVCIDDLDITVNDYQTNPLILNTVSETTVTETLFSHLLKSNCLVTDQPDWGSLSVNYKGKQIDREALLKYIISYRNHNEFHEQCVERVFKDILNQCQPQSLTVFARYTRRGGLDINPYRSTEALTFVDSARLFRQ